MKLMNLGSPTSEKIVSLGFCTSGGLRISNGLSSWNSSEMGSLGFLARISSPSMVSPIKSLGFQVELLPMCVDVIVTSECIHLCILCIVPHCLFRDVSVM